MRIETVTLENIRSHTKSRIDFEKGFNCLVGGLGTGKSSILYAIDFAFFASLQSPFNAVDLLAVV